MFLAGLRVPCSKTGSVAALLLSLWPLPLCAETSEEPGLLPEAQTLQRFKPGGMAEVAEVPDGGSLILTDGREIRLAGIQAPPRPPWLKDNTLWPPAEQARAVLGELVRDRRLQLYYGGQREDRHGRVLAHLVNAGGTWLQAEMLRRGLARVQAFPGNASASPELLRIEGAARAAGRGIWRHDHYAVRRPDDLEQLMGQFHLVEGRVLKVAVVRGRAYLNFGEDWRRDFTLVIGPAERRRFTAAGIDPVIFEGRRLRARGWLEFRNGVAINITHPEQIEVLD